MKKDFKKWHSVKTTIENAEKQRVFFHEREVWWCSIGFNIGFEQDGRGGKFARPVLIFKKFNKEVCWALPLSTKIKIGKFYALADLGDNIARVAIISQLRLVDAKRFIGKIGTLSDENYTHIQKAVINICSS